MISGSQPPPRRYFYPRPPGGGRRPKRRLWLLLKQFLSTPSGWRATCFGGGLLLSERFLSTPSGWRATKIPAHLQCPARISIHALRVEGDPQSKVKESKVKISIHALRVEGDRRKQQRRKQQRNFYPRPPGGGRQQKRTKFSSVFAKKGEEFASLRRGKRKICRWRFKKDKFWVLIWCEGSRKSVCALASHCG